MSKKTDRLVAQAAIDAEKSADKVAAAQAADRESALSSPAEREPSEGVPVPPLVKVSPQSAETRGPLVALTPLSEVHPSTIEAAVGFQQIPNDQINGVFEDKDGVKRDALGHPFSK